MSATARTRANLLLLLAAFIWGMAFTAQKVANAVMGPISFTAVRFAMGATVLLLVVALRDRKAGLTSNERRARTRAVIVPGVVCGALLALAVNIQQVALDFTSVGNAAFITGLYLVFVPLLGLFTGGKVLPLTVIGIALAVAGSYLIAVRADFTIGLGDIIVVGAALAFAVQILVVDRVGPHLDPVRFSVAQFYGCAVYSTIAALLLDERPFTGLLDGWLPLAYGGLLSVGVAYTIQVIAQRDALASHAALIMSMEAVFGAVGGWLLLHERLGSRGLIGAALMLAGLVVSQFGQLKRPTPAD
ncbi:MAG: DMT family transporter [Propionibacteriaceae bacterium]|jgi:drug/metabolite transporter (DMT)-like permease|nr:DMT family transporter [Propionibacteriaceae bacterium]